jgi:hypothetical protein
MHLTDHDLRQLDRDALSRLGDEALRRLAERLLADLKDARDRLNQDSRNSSPVGEAEETAEASDDGATAANAPSGAAAPPCGASPGAAAGRARVWPNPEADCQRRARSLAGAMRGL